jgi:hypothetical protein
MGTGRAARAFVARGEPGPAIRRLSLREERLDLGMPFFNLNINLNLQSEFEI